MVDGEGVDGRGAPFGSAYGAGRPCGSERRAPGHGPVPPEAGRCAPAASDGGRVVCDACPHACSLAEGQRGRCRARVARGGRVVCEGYGRLTALALDPVEKKPLARWRSGSNVLSVGGYGCNLACPFCQNADIACAGPKEARWREVSPEALVDLALRARPRNVGIAYTYNEPLVCHEFVRDAGRLAHEAGLANVLVSNGMASEGVVKELLPLIDAANIDLKGFSQEFYDLVGGDFDAVRRTIEALAACPTCHLEVTTLVVPGLNDDHAAIDAAAAWLASLDPSIPYHLTRFFPCHRMTDRPPTPPATLRRLADVARRHLDDVLVGNC
ncbi:MAG TPA: AmmeMemoRadiSam system radical SAM enzyme [Candidatus Rubneribacter avistercoris]|nr:AmmeMemoRadiSam system radical SAM enzyme [Candidatus Rubneribacter avistercoris]